MAVIKLGTTKIANRLISYAEKRAEVATGINCTTDTAKYQFETTRLLYGKTDSIQAHHVIQSFKPNELTAKQANAIGVDLANRIASGHECAVYTHADKKHIHNHIVINSVSFENGKKYQQHGKKAIDKIRVASDELCREKGLSIVTKKTAAIRYSLSEKAILEKGQSSWKEKIRQAVDYEKTESKSYQEFKENMKANHGITVDDSRKHITYKTAKMNRVVRGTKLGEDYERGTLENGFRRQIESGEKYRGIDRDIKQAEQKLGDGNELYKSSNERGNVDNCNVRNGIGENKNDKQRNINSNDFDFGKAEKLIAKRRQQSAMSFEKFRAGDTGEQFENAQQAERDKHNEREQAERDTKFNRKQLSRVEKPIHGDELEF